MSTQGRFALEEFVPVDRFDRTREVVVLDRAREQFGRAASTHEWALAEQDADLLGVLQARLDLAEAVRREVRGRYTYAVGTHLREGSGKLREHGAGEFVVGDEAPHFTHLLGSPPPRWRCNRLPDHPRLLGVLSVIGTTVRRPTRCSTGICPDGDSGIPNASPKSPHIRGRLRSADNDSVV